MKKIGLVTLWANNYGSALQCYALKSEIENRGYCCQVMGECAPGLDKYKHYVKELASISSIAVRHPSFLKKYFVMRNAIKYSVNSLSAESDFRLNLFCERVLQPRRYSMEHLRKLAQRDEYQFFVAGSDQIWAGNRKMEDFFFLSFAPFEKRIAFAPSFGTEKVDDYNRRSFSREISKFSKLSAREKSGQKIIRDLTGRDVPRIADPTFLKTQDEWAEFAKESQVIKEIDSKKYIFVHFLDEPNDVAIQCLNYFCETTDLEIFGFAYPHEALQSIPQYHMVNGDPVDYVALIEHAEYVLTDSFHTTLFSVIFGREFFTFVRQYRHSGSQQSRITTLLELVGYNARLIQSMDGFKDELNAELHSCDAILEQERDRARTYLTDAIGEKNEEASSNRAKKVTLATEEMCTGCLACYSACETGAISIETTSFGFEIPRIDSELCVNCGRCQSVCAVINKSDYNTGDYKRTAYAAYNNDSDLRSIAASGGVFAALASSFLQSGGVVFGARLSFEEGEPVIKHIPIYSLEELPTILQSKYVQSDASSAYPQIKKLLQHSKRVLFCGTSCQVDALYHFLNDNIKEQYGKNLFTVDLICHGVPGRKFFQDYVELREKQNNNLINDFTFRLKDNLQKRILYQETLTMSSDRGEKGKICIPANKSSYYRLFLGEESYRDACYECRYASVDKPADITIGDYFELKDDYPDLYAKLSKYSVWDINSVIVQSFQGEKLLNLAENSIVIFPVDIRRVQASHKQLCKPSHHTLEREKVMMIYRKKGFAGIDSHYRNRDRLLYFPIKVKRMLSR